MQQQYDTNGPAPLGLDDESIWGVVEVDEDGIVLPVKPNTLDTTEYPVTDMGDCYLVTLCRRNSNDSIHLTFRFGGRVKRACLRDGAVSVASRSDGRFDVSIPKMLADRIGIDDRYVVSAR